MYSRIGIYKYFQQKKRNDCSCQIDKKGIMWYDTEYLPIEGSKLLCMENEY